MNDLYDKLYSDCTLCPRQCRVDRTTGQLGVCGCGASAIVNLTMLHRGEEPILGGDKACGAVFFEGCQLRCVFCQNHDISRRPTSKGMSLNSDELASKYIELEAQGASCIDLVTPMHFAPTVAQSIRIAKNKGIKLPFVLNVGGYESVSTLQLFDGLIDIYLPDLKFYSSEVSSLLSSAPDYFEVATKAFAEMYRQVGPASLKDGLLTKGMIVRHLMLPGLAFDSKHICQYLTDTYGNNIYISLMNQYTPMPLLDNSLPAKLKESLSHKLNPRAYDILIDFLCDMGQTNAFVQEEGSDTSDLIPNFNK